MHSYPLNSPQAAARVLAVVLLADGHCSDAELGMLRAPNTAAKLGVSPQALDEVIHGLVNDLMLANRSEWTGAGRMDGPTRDQLLAEVTAPDLQDHLLALALSLVQVDGHVAEGEQAVLDAMAFAWQRPAALAPAVPKACSFTASVKATLAAPFGAAMAAPVALSLAA